MANKDYVLIMEEPFTEEEIEQIKTNYIKNMKWAYSLSEEQKSFLMDEGWYNEAMRGYLIEAAQNADFSHDEIKRLLNGLRCVLSDKGKEEAENVSQNY